MRDRVKKLIDHSGKSLPELEAETGISQYKWGNLLTGKQRVNEDHIAALNKLWPQFTYWLVTGHTIPDAGQISPELEQIREDSRKEGRVG